MIFEFDEPDVRDSYFTLWDKLDGTERCVEDPDSYVENWTARAIPEATARKLCEGCHVIEEFRAYARLAGEETGIWGGETPEMRKHNDT